MEKKLSELSKLREARLEVPIRAGEKNYPLKGS